MFKKNNKDRNLVNKDNSKKIFSYYQNRDQAGLNTNKAKKSMNKRNVFFSNFPVIISILVIIVSILYTSTLSSTPNIIIVNKDSLLNNDKNSDKLNRLVSNRLQRSFLNKSKITINTDKIQNELLEEISEATDIAIALPIISRSPVVYIRIAEPSFLLSSDNKDFILDEKGRAISEDAKLSKELIVVKDKSGLVINSGDQAIPTKQASFIKQINQQFTGKKHKIEYFELSKNANELLVKMQGAKYFIKFNLSGNPSLQSGTALSTIKYLKQKNIKPSQYIDVRVEERAYYR